MSNTDLRSGAERSCPLPHAGPDARLTGSLVNSVAAVLVAYGFPGVDASADRTPIESVLGAFVYNPLENRS
ncbi:hypothetical protein AB0932_01385 [Streptomyces sp. NPDC006682]|uniref:hypothetical protein n=1 Tax=unclassified Streptomyces TaxID=2593676 RepID=UPI003455A16F